MSFPLQSIFHTATCGIFLKNEPKTISPCTDNDTFIGSLSSIEAVSKHFFIKPSMSKQFLNMYSQYMYIYFYILYAYYFTNTLCTL